MAPGIGTPSRSHSKVKLGAPVQAPGSHVSVWPSTGEPEIDGGDVFDGGDCATVSVTSSAL